jgi:hypothetical protein
MPSIEEKVQDLDTDVVLNKKTRSGKAAASSTITAPDQPQVPKRKRKPAIRKIKESPYVVEEVEGFEDSTNLVTRELKKKKAEDVAAEALQKALKIAQEIEIPASSFVRKDVGADDEEIIQVAEDVQKIVTSEAGNLMMIVSASEGTTAEPEGATTEADTGIPDSPTHIVVNVESGSSSPSQSTSSSSSIDSDDLPIGHKYNIKNKQLKTNIPQEPVRTAIDERVNGLAQRKEDLYNRFPVSFNPLRPPMVQPLNMVPSDENIEPSSSSQPSASSNQTEDNTFIDNLVSHYSGELPEVSPSLEKASEVTSEAVATEEVTLESTQQQTPNPQIDPQISSDHIASPEHVSASEHVSLSEPVVPEHIVPEQLAPEQTQSSTILLPGSVIKITRFDGVFIATSMDTDYEDDQDDHQSSSMDIETIPNQLSTCNPQTPTSTNDQPSSSNLAIVHVAQPKTTKIPSTPTIFLDSTLLQNVCENICQELVQLIQAIADLVHKENYEKRWSVTLTF